MRSFYVKLTEGTDLGPYGIKYIDYIDGYSHIATLHDTDQLATSIPYMDLITGDGVLIDVSDYVKEIIIYNENELYNEMCYNPEDIYEVPTPTPTPTPTITPIPVGDCNQYQWVCDVPIGTHMTATYYDCDTYENISIDFIATEEPFTFCAMADRPKSIVNNTNPDYVPCELVDLGDCSDNIKCLGYRLQINSGSVTFSYKTCNGFDDIITTPESYSEYYFCALEGSVEIIYGDGIVYYYSDCDDLPDNSVNYNPFIFEIDLTHANLNELDFVIPFKNYTGYNCTIDWGDGTSLSNISSYDDVDRFHTYSSVGQYQIKINGICKGITFGSLSKNHRTKLSKVIKWGDVGFINMADMFKDCAYFDDVPNSAITGCESVSDFSGMFYNTFLSSVPDNLFSLCTSADTFENTFQNCQVLLSLPENMFKGTGTVETFQNCFSGCSNLRTIHGNLLKYITTSNLSGMFHACEKMTNIPVGFFDYVQGVNNIDGMFGFCKTLSYYPKNLLKNLTDGEINSYTGLFKSCTGLFRANALTDTDNTKITDITSIFTDCTNLTILDSTILVHYPNLEIMNYAFSGCIRLTQFPGDNDITSPNHIFNLEMKPKEMRYSFRNCESFTENNVVKFWDNSRYNSTDGHRCYDSLSGISRWWRLWYIPLSWK